MQLSAYKQIETLQRENEKLIQQNEKLQEIQINASNARKISNENFQKFIHELKENDDHQQKYLDQVITQQIQNSNQRFLELQNYYKNLAESLDQSRAQDAQQMMVQILQIKQQHEAEIKTINKNFQERIIKIQRKTQQKIESQERRHQQSCQDYEKKIECLKQKESSMQSKVNFLKESNQSLEQKNLMLQKNDQISQTQFENLQRHNKQLDQIINEKKDIYDQLKQNYEQIYEDYQNVQQQLDIFKIKSKNNIQSSTSNIDTASQISWFKKIRQDKSIEFPKENQPLILPANAYETHKGSFDTDNNMNSIDQIINNKESTAKKSSRVIIGTSSSKRKNTQQFSSSMNNSLYPMSQRLSAKYDENNTSFPLTPNKSDTQQEATFTQNSTPSFLTMIENDKQCDRDIYLKDLYTKYESFKSKLSGANQAYQTRKGDYNQLYQEINDELESFYEQLDSQHQIIINSIKIKTISKFDQSVFSLLRSNKLIDLTIVKFVQIGQNIYYVFKITDKLVSKDWYFKLRFSQIYNFFLKVHYEIKGFKFNLPPKKFFNATSLDFLNKRLNELQSIFSNILQSLDQIDMRYLKEFFYLSLNQEKDCFEQVFQPYESFYQDLGYKLNSEKFKGYLNTLSLKIKNIENDIEILEKNEMFIILELQRQRTISQRLNY